MLTARDLRFKWPDGRVGVDGASFSAERGTSVAVVGRSGAGKTTLLKLMAELVSPDSGAVDNPNGRPILVHQEPSLWPHLTLLQNVATPLHVIQGLGIPRARAIAAETLSDWGLGDLLGGYPGELSGGEQQRGAVARAIVLNPSILCLDEVTSALDAATARQTLNRIMAWRGSHRIVVFVTHDLQFAAKEAHQVLFLEGGRLVEVGATQQLLRDPRHPATRNFLEEAGVLSVK